MGRKKAPYLKAPSRPIFQTLPPELLHVTFSQLFIEDILALRTTCSIFASVGLDYFANEVPLVFHRAKFKALTEIAENPKLSKQMRSLYYVFDRCKLQSYEEWDSNRPDPQPQQRWGYDSDDEFHTQRDFRACIREGRKDAVELQKRVAGIPERARRTAYEKFRALCQEPTSRTKATISVACEHCSKAVLKFAKSRSPRSRISSDA